MTAGMASHVLVPVEFWEEPNLSDMATQQETSSPNDPRFGNGPTDVIRGIFLREMSGASMRATAVEREEHGLFAAAIRHYKSWGEAIRTAGLDVEAISRRRTWTAQRVIQTIYAMGHKGIALNLRSVRKFDQGPIQAARKFFGSWDNALRAAGYDPLAIRLVRRPWTRSELIVAIQAHAAIRPVVTQNGLPSSGIVSAARRVFGSFKTALHRAGVGHQIHKFPRWSKAQVVKEIRQRRDTGQPIHCAGVIATRPRLYDAARRYCGGWSQALRAAGEDPIAIRQKRSPWTAEDVIAELRRRARSKQPATCMSYIRPASFVKACITFFGSLEAAAVAARVDPRKIGYHRSKSNTRPQHGARGQ
mgnify:CR=1 FL=1